MAQIGEVYDMIGLASGYSKDIDYFPFLARDDVVESLNTRDWCDNRGCKRL